MWCSDDIPGPDVLHCLTGCYDIAGWRVSQVDGFKCSAVSADEVPGVSSERFVPEVRTEVLVYREVVAGEFVDTGWLCQLCFMVHTLLSIRFLR